MLNSFDVTNACNSFLQAMNVANSIIITGAVKNVLSCSGEIGSYVANRQINSLDELDVKMGGLTLGDAGPAMILSASDGNIGILEINLMNLGEHWEQCHAPEKTAWGPSGGEDLGFLLERTISLKEAPSVMATVLAGTGFRQVSEFSNTLSLFILQDV
ncbi:hypothetical protein [Chlorobaculum tepidum]|nr:hypothetical protein [Chlorobaculum tepidum]